MKTFREFSEEQQPTQKQYTLKQQRTNVETENENFRQIDQVIRELYSKVDALETEVAGIKKRLN